MIWMMKFNLFKKLVLKHFNFFYLIKLNIMLRKELTYSIVNNVLDQLKIFKT